MRFPVMLYPDKDKMARWMVMLHDAGAVPFRDLQSDPAYRTILLTPDKVTRPDDHRLILKAPRFVYAVRFRYSYDPRAFGAPALHLEAGSRCGRVSDGVSITADEWRQYAGGLGQ